MNIYDYYVGAKKVSNNRNYVAYHPQNIISNIVVDKDKNLVTFDIRTKSSDAKETYVSLLQFSTKIYSEEDLEGVKDNYNSIEYNNQVYYIEPIDKFTDVKTWCSCSDYKFTFDWYNYENGLSCGNPPEPYESKGMRPPRNPEHFNGICKHLYQAFVLLQEQGYVV